MSRGRLLFPIVVAVGRGDPELGLRTATAVPGKVFSNADYLNFARWKVAPMMKVTRIEVTM